MEELSGLESIMRDDAELIRINEKTIKQLEKLKYKDLLAIAASQINGRRADSNPEADRLTQLALSKIQNITPEIYHFENPETKKHISREDIELISSGKTAETNAAYLIPLRGKKSIDQTINSGYILGFMEIKKEEATKEKIPFLELYARSHGFTTHHGLAALYLEGKIKEAELNQTQVERIGDYLRHEIAGPLNSLILGLELMKLGMQSMAANKEELKLLEKQLSLSSINYDVLTNTLDNIRMINEGFLHIGKGIDTTINGLEVTKLIGGTPHKLKNNPDEFASHFYQICELAISNSLKNYVKSEGNKTLIFGTEKSLESRMTLIDKDHGLIVLNNILGNCGKYCPYNGLVYVQVHENEKNIFFDVTNTSDRVYSEIELENMRLGKHENHGPIRKGHGTSEGIGMSLIDLFMRKTYEGKLTLESGEKIDLTDNYMRDDVKIRTDGDPRISKIISPYFITRLEFPKKNFDYYTVIMHME